MRLVIGPKDLEENTAEVMRRDTLGKETVSLDGIVDYVANLLEDIQNNIYTKARNFRDSHIFEANSYDEFKEPYRKGWLRSRTLGRHYRNRRARKRRDKSHNPMHSFGRRHNTRHLHFHRQAF